MGMKIMGQDKYKHIVVSFALTLFCYWVFGVIAGSALLAFLIGVAKEVYDYNDYGVFDHWDILANTFGIASAVSLLYLTV
ncbi:hypothetical protein NX722_23620 [Endozoicomonas gorgoniicola]|uniref:Uncharacterized protein n=1 Tax=Endozoicomonas gorgoniicola TaxID=1234144 RepID=A0ABT3N1P6_9GAMM|nr:hypothetical protein [Endozoicomonas gorgoniicola]MCW7555557.1 hypothetical protein [Endozoicomonas gorgoniicola]